MANKNWIAMKPKVKAAFTELEKQGIRAEMNFSDTLSDGTGEIWDESYDGFAFYHSQDTENVENNGELVIAYGSMKDNATKSDIEAIGKKVVAALEKQKLLVEWIGDAESRIYVYLNEKAYDAATGEAKYYNYDFDRTNVLKRQDKLEELLKQEGFETDRSLSINALIQFDHEERKKLDQLKQIVKKTKQTVVELGTADFTYAERLGEHFMIVLTPVVPEDYMEVAPEARRVAELAKAAGFKIQEPTTNDDWIRILLSNTMKRR